MTHAIIDEARRLASSFEKEVQKNKDEETKRIAEWEIDHAKDMVENMKHEFCEKVIEAGREGRYSTYLSIYSWSPHGRPHWVRHFFEPFEEFLYQQGVSYHFKDEEREDDPEMPRNASGGYTITWTRE